MENETPTKHCRNCDAPLPSEARFCPQCSQRNHDGRLTFREMVAEAMGTLFNLDNRIFSTLRAMVVPGKLTTEYFEGKHIRYYHPLRLFLFTGLALISVLTVRYRQGPAYAQMEKMSEDIKRNHLHKKTYEHLDSLRAAFIAEQNNPITQQAVDSFASLAEFLNYTTENIDSSSFGINLFGGKIKGVNASTADVMELSAEALLDKYKVEGFWNRLFISRSVRIMKGGTNEFMLSLFGNAIWMLLVLMPLMALVLKLLYARKPFLYYEHFVFNLHLHAASFTIIFLCLVFAKHPPVWLIAIGALVSFLYPYFALKRVYQQGFWKTNLKYFIISIAYTVLAMTTFILLAVLSFALF
jgi:Protein of unknown function (DUF3667)